MAENAKLKMTLIFNIFRNITAKVRTLLKIAKKYFVNFLVRILTNVHYFKELYIYTDIYADNLKSLWICWLSEYTDLL